ncbi:MAG: hypothetical protein CO156_04410 [Candidatus Pacebacteria bacterium CG_4_9_14_3_um_filter_40_12]|nr:MAG: hypothetical protein COU64_05815 [Candidatus Pacebacteria bacterium CG10_big_fil_rev_8_21_14_0_10_40_26]PIZ78235.1 MAG: hypothetical protein COY01_05635 [Candidatus Pacebacteria bacterium CG_4_10_14_0_2_um_filter_40_20]PJA68720.1 MAG: hypothetical protein CO156_04410 [Candidatus Pacebacteria bacterium CG_4_9_14_3_um_filter_40_12]PJC41660.1 MAG: hypothetical protein CO041_03000 [Candidatus Pacebacteria bacterium CG_4_9_14_0_2_um_filter_40_15]
MNHTQKRLLVVNTGNLLKKFIFKRLKELDVSIVVLNCEKNWADSYVDDWILADTTDHAASLAAVKAYAAKNTIDGVITFWEDDVLLTSKIATAQGLVGIPLEIAKIARNKLFFRKFCESEGLQVPKFFKFTTIEELQKAKSELQFPVVVKPTYGTSSAFVTKVEEPEQLDKTIAYIQSSVSVAMESALHEGLTIMVEEYIDGDEVDIDMLLQNGKLKFWSITDNHASSEPFFIETGDTFPSLLSDDAQEELVSMAEVMLEKIGIQDGCIHFEAKYSSNGPMPIEINLRLGGGYYYSFIKKAWNVDLIESSVKIALGEYIPKMTKPENPKKYFAADCFIQKESGIISSLEFPKSFAAQDKVHDFVFFKEVGDTVLTPPLSFDYLGWICAYGDNPHDAQENLQKAKAQVSFEIVPFSGLSKIGKTIRKSPISPAWLQSSEGFDKKKIDRVHSMPASSYNKLVIGIACNQYTGEDGSVEAELTNVGKNIQKALESKGYKTIFIDFNDIGKSISILQQGKIDFVFNVAERLNNSSLLEPHVASLLDIFQIPYTGSSPFTLGLCLDKIRVKKMLTYHEIPTAKWDYVYSVDEAVDEELEYPLIVKPANTDNSIGITQQSVVKNAEELKAQIKYVTEELQRPALIEEYLDGDEYDVSIFGSELDDVRVLPLSRSIFKHDDPKKWNIYSFDSKWSASDHGNVEVQRPPKNVSKKLLSLISEIALDTYNILGCHDYGRVEIKLDRNGNPHVLELNPNPSINIPDCVPSVAKLTGMSYEDFIEQILLLAIKRYKDKLPYHHLQPVV